MKDGEMGLERVMKCVGGKGRKGEADYSEIF